MDPHQVAVQEPRPQPGFLDQDALQVAAPA
jgi:hypothetical protein